MERGGQWKGSSEAISRSELQKTSQILELLFVKRVAGQTHGELLYKDLIPGRDRVRTAARGHGHCASPCAGWEGERPLAARPSRPLFPTPSSSGWYFSAYLPLRKLLNPCWKWISMCCLKNLLKNVRRRCGPVRARAKLRPRRLLGGGSGRWVWDVLKPL